MKQDLIVALHQILTTKNANERFYFARLLGFRSEIALTKYLTERGEQPLEGGQFLFPWDKMAGPENELIYVTVSKDEKERYVDLYRILASIPIVKRLYFIFYSHMGGWQSCTFRVKNASGIPEDISIPEPDFRYYNFIEHNFQECDRSNILDGFQEKSRISYAAQKEDRLGYLSKYSLSLIENIYANRFFLEVLLGEYKKGMIDFDGIIERTDQFWLVESKEKDAGGNEGEPYFGWDSRRLAWYLYLQNCCGLKTLYIIRQVNNQEERRFVDWKYITLDDFAVSASWLSERGGGGGSGTITAPLTAFNRLNDLFG